MKGLKKFKSQSVAKPHLLRILLPHSAAQRTALPQVRIERLPRCWLRTKAPEVTRAKQELQATNCVDIHDPNHTQGHRPRPEHGTQHGLMLIHWTCVRTCVCAPAFLIWQCISSFLRPKQLQSFRSVQIPCSMSSPQQTPTTVRERHVLSHLRPEPTSQMPKAKRRVNLEILAPPSPNLAGHARLHSTNAHRTADPAPSTLNRGMRARAEFTRDGAHLHFSGRLGECIAHADWAGRSAANRSRGCLLRHWLGRCSGMASTCQAMRNTQQLPWVAARTVSFPGGESNPRALQRPESPQLLSQCWWIGRTRGQSPAEPNPEPLEHSCGDTHS